MTKTSVKMKKKVVEKVITKGVISYDKFYWWLFFYYMSIIQK